jgi:NodT family efflux transporter outer membrane factor (OMF) lipoprotein
MSEPTRGLRPTTSATTAIATAIALISTSACAVGMKYQRPEMPAPPAYRESLPQGWTDAQPRDSAPRGQWWSAFNDPDLDALEGRVSISNQNVLAAEAQFRAAQATVRVTRADEFPTVSLSPSATIAGGAARTLGTGAALAGSHLYSIPLDATYQADVWGSIRRSVKANAAIAQASAADLENARLLYESEIASDYFQLQGLDAEQRVLGSAVQSYERSLELTRDRFQGGVASMGDVALAETQLETARGQLTDVGIARAQFEHAIAVLTGRAPSEVSIPEATMESTPPTVTVGLPSTLLERRPDIAAAERRVAAANEQIGVARAAFYPALTFGGTAGSQAIAIADLLTTPTRIWSVGVQLAETLFDGGKRRAQVRLTQAEYDAAVATYKQAVLTGFQQVDDALVELDRLAQEADIASRAVAAAQQSVDIANIQYTGGLVNYLQVVTAQTSLLQNQRSAIDILTRRLVASVSLIQSLGGGWDASQLPSATEVRR